MRITLVLALILAACGQQAGQPAQPPAPSDVVYVQDGDQVVRIDAIGVTTVSRAGVLTPDRVHRITAETADPTGMASQSDGPGCVDLALCTEQPQSSRVLPREPLRRQSRALDQL